MNRTFSIITNDQNKELLNKLLNKNITPTDYRETMTQIGISFGNILIQTITDHESKIYLACTVEDADFLAKGILKQLENYFKSVSFACFWNQRFAPSGIEELRIAPIIKKYQEPSEGKIDYLIIVKSIISGACVVRTNLTDLIQKIEPKHIFIIAPVISNNAEQKLKDEFEEPIYDKFKFFYFAKDNKENGEVIPGIGGSVYERLGFQGQDDKNRYVPEIVKLRRAKLLKTQSFLMN